MNLAELEERYAEMSDVEFARLSREDLLAAATPYYDREARRRGLPDPEARAQRAKISLLRAKAPPQSMLTQARERLASCAKADLSRLDKLYAEISEEDLARLNRRDLSPAARICCDRAARCRGLAKPKNQPAASRNPPSALAELDDHLLRTRYRHLNLAELEKRYAEMSDEEFALLSRQDLAGAVIPYYDCEARRRGLPDPESQAQHSEIAPSDTEAEATASAALIPDPEQILREAKSRRADRLRALEALDDMPRSNQGPGNIYKIYKRSVVPADQRGDKLIVWLRRFHVKRSKALRFDQLLIAACQGLGFPLTVQDSTFKSSEGEAMPRLVPFWFLWSCGIFAGFMGLIKPPFPVALAWFILLPLVFYFLSGQIGYHALGPSTAREQTLDLILDIRDRQGKHGDDSVLIVRCQDSFWREIVQLCLRHASAVVIDVTEVSENVIWELKTALQLMAPESITLAQGLGQDDETQVTREARDILAAELGADGSDRVQTFFYPRRADQLKNGLWGTRKSLEEELQARLAVAVAYSEYRRAFGSSDSDC